MTRTTPRPTRDRWEVEAYRLDLIADRRGQWRLRQVIDTIPVSGPCSRAEALFTAALLRTRYASHPVSFRTRRVGQRNG